MSRLNLREAFEHCRLKVTAVACIWCQVLWDFFYIHGSVHRNSVLIRSNKMQQYAGVYLQQITLRVSGRTHHQEYTKL